MLKHLAAFACFSALASTATLADDKAPPEKGKTNAMPTAKDKQRAVDATTNAYHSSGSDSLGMRGPAGTGKNWDDMTPEEKDDRRKRWLLNSGDFKGPRSPRSVPKSLPTTQDGKSAVDAAERATTPKPNIPAK